VARTVKQEPDTEGDSPSDTATGDTTGDNPGSSGSSGGNPLVEALKMRIRELEAAAAAEKYKCLICMVSY
jgi:hypothetical protein